MAWDWLKRQFSSDNGGKKAGATAQIQWLTDNPWGVPVLDVRPVTLHMLSMSESRECAENAVSFTGDDGTAFSFVEPRVSRWIPAKLQFGIDKALADGALFIPQEMEHKWAIYFHRRRIICIRSWTRSVEIVAETAINGDTLDVTAIIGVFTSEDEPHDYTVGMLDFLLRSHALNEVYPAPLPRDIEQEPDKAALWCMSCFGNRVQFATPNVIDRQRPAHPLRTHSLLHFAVARGNADQVRVLLKAGIPVDLLAQDGLSPLHWAVAREDTAMLSLLLECGSPTDVRSAEGTTALMNAAQARSLEKVKFLLDHCADPNAADHRGFTALHRAAEMGEKEIVQLLFDRGASPNLKAQGHTPRSLAALRGEKAIVEILDRQMGGSNPIA